MTKAEMVVERNTCDANHLVPDLLQPGLRVVFCGTALGKKSFEERAYYAHPGNLFWRTLYAVGLTPRLIRPQEYAELPRYGIGLTDVCKTAYGNDADLAADDFDGKATRERIALYAPDTLAFTSKKAASVFTGKPTSALPYGLQPEKFGNTQLFVLTSPSGHARKWWNETIWQQLSDLVQPALIKGITA